MYTYIQKYMAIVRHRAVSEEIRTGLVIGKTPLLFDIATLYIQVLRVLTSDI